MTKVQFIVTEFSIQPMLVTAMLTDPVEVDTQQMTESRIRMAIFEAVKDQGTVDFSDFTYFIRDSYGIALNNRQSFTVVMVTPDLKALMGVVTPNVDGVKNVLKNRVSPLLGDHMRPMPGVQWNGTANGDDCDAYAERNLDALANEVISACGFK